MSVLFSHLNGNANVRNALEGLHNAGILKEFITTVATFDGTLFSLLSKTRVGAEFNRKRYPQHLKCLTRQQPFSEIVRILASRKAIGPLVSHEKGLFSVDRIYQRLDRYAARRVRALANDDLRAVYCYEDGALSTFLQARELGLRRIYDLPIGYWRLAKEIQEEEADRNPEWIATMPALRNSEAKLARKDEELKLADAIIVASRFTAESLKKAPFSLAEPIIIPYGCPSTSLDSANAIVKPRCGPRPLKVLYVGSLSQRKGLSYLFEAVSGMEKAVELTLIGKRFAGCKPLDTALEKWRWIESLPHRSILETMRHHDVLVFPSLFEGFGLVITEALSQGVPVISTTNTCAPDIFRDGKEGFIVPIRDASAISTKLELLHNDRSLLSAMKQAARDLSKKTTWETYGSSVASAVQKITKPANPSTHS